MAFRRPGALLALERDILVAVLAHGDEGTHGFALARQLAEGEGRRLTAHGTLDKALDRLRVRGLLDAAWEDAAVAEGAGRPRRRR